MAPSSTVEEGDNVTFTCNFTTTVYQNNLTWIFNRQPMKEKNRNFLTMQNVSRKDTGEYSCHVKNAIGEGTDSASILIKCNNT